MVLDLTTDELAAIEVAANPIPRDRGLPSDAVAVALAVVHERGPGVVHRVIRLFESETLSGSQIDAIVVRCRL
jgi:hypothetical protein